MTNGGGKWTRRAAAALLGVVVAGLGAELGLRFFDFNVASVNAGYMQFGYAQGIPAFDEDGVLVEGRSLKVRLFEPDPETFWRPIPDAVVTNSFGFRGRTEPVPGDDPERIRIAFIGDSCTFLGNPVYPELIQLALQRRFADRDFDCINASCPGYSSFQGTKVLPRIEEWRPEAVVVNFGWNDHFQSIGGLSDSAQYALQHGLRSVGLVRAWLASRSHDPVMRGPLEHYEDHLEEIRDTIIGWGAVPIFVTAPSAFVDGAMPDWSYNFYGKYHGMDRETVDAIPRMHAAQVEAVRRVASEPPCILVDAAAEFPKSAEPIEKVFRKDLAHFRTSGHRMMADLVGPAVLKVVRRAIARQKGS